MGLLLACPRSERSQGCLLHLEPPSRERAHSWRAQICYKLLIPMLANRGTCRQLGTGHCERPAPYPGQEAQEETEISTWGLPGEGGLGPNPLRRGDGCAAASLRSISWHRTPRQPDHRVSQVCLHRNKCRAIDGQRCVGRGLWHRILHCQGILQGICSLRFFSVHPQHR